MVTTMFHFMLIYIDMIHFRPFSSEDTYAKTFLRFIFKQ